MYELIVKSGTLSVGLYYLRISIDTFFGKIYAAHSNRELLFTDTDVGFSMPQLTVSDMLRKFPSICGGVIYHIFVDRFARGSHPTVRNRADRLIEGEWTEIPEVPQYPGAPMKNNTFYGGTLWGIAEELDYIASLGVNAIYLSPIFSSPSNHKYDTSDYLTVDSGFGGDEALGYLIREAGRRDIVIILDGVFNHTGDDSIYFNKYSNFKNVGAYQSTKSPYYGWYTFKSFPDEYECWWGIKILPRINTQIPSCRKYFLGENGVIEKYRKMGVYGWRLDVVDELPCEFIEGIRERMSKNSDFVIYGEVWEDASNKIAYGERRKYYLGKQLDGAMNYPLREGIVAYVTEKNLHSLRNALNVLLNAPEPIMSSMMNIMGSHDTPRILTVIEARIKREINECGYEDKRNILIKLLKSIYTLVYTLPGIPTVFYGDEVGLSGGNDPLNRMPYPWGSENSEILEHFRTIGSVRRKNAVYLNGILKVELITEDVFVFSRYIGDSRCVTAYNNSNKPISLHFVGECVSLLNSVSGKDFVLPPITASVFRADGVKGVTVKL